MIAEKAAPDYEYAISANKIDGCTLLGFFKKKKSKTETAPETAATPEENLEVAESSEKGKTQTAVPEKGTSKENLSVAPVICTQKVGHN